MKSRLLFFSLTLLFSVSQGFGQHYFSKELLSTRSERKEMRQKASVADGAYLLFQGGLRKHENATSNDIFTGGYGEYNGVVGVNYGYMVNNASLETGLGFIWHYHSNLHYIEPASNNMQTYGNFNSIFLPIIVKYDVPTGPSKKFRFGVMGSINFLLHQTRKPIPQGREIYYFDYFNQRDNFVDYKYFIDGPSVSGFFKAGLYAEFQVFKSSFLNLQFSRAISASPGRTVQYQWEYKNVKGSFTDEFRIEGYMMEISYKFPLNLLTVY